VVLYFNRLHIFLAYNYGVFLLLATFREICCILSAPMVRRIGILMVSELTGIHIFCYFFTDLYLLRHGSLLSRDFLRL